jgi:hypothetical protein
VPGRRWQQPISWPLYQEPPPGHQPYVPFISWPELPDRAREPTIGWK